MTRPADATPVPLAPVSDPAQLRAAGRRLGDAEPARAEILVVDDEPTVVSLLIECLTLAGYHGTGANSAPKALELLRSRAFDAMFCDLLMPEMTGIELMVKARLDAPDMPIILITAVADTDTAVRAMRLGAYDYLTKPISPGEVVLHVTSALETHRHVVENRRAQERLQASYKQLRGLTEVKDNLVQMLVHDLKTPLASAMGYMELLARKAEGSFSERQLHYLQQAHGSCRDVLRMTATMLDVARLEHGALELHPVQLDLAELLHEAAADLEIVISASGGRIDVACHPGAAHAVGDSEIVRRVLSNLLSNAAKHTPPGSSVRLTTEPGEGGAAIVSVADDGNGIPPDDRERIFEKFYQLGTGTEAGGAGIGLAFCRMAVEAHGGKIWVESAPGKGSTFRFCLPTASLAGHTPSPVEPGEAP